MQFGDAALTRDGDEFANDQPERADDQQNGEAGGDRAERRGAGEQSLDQAVDP